MSLAFKAPLLPVHFMLVENLISPRAIQFRLFADVLRGAKIPGRVFSGNPFQRSPPPA